MVIVSFEYPNSLHIQTIHPASQPGSTLVHNEERLALLVDDFVVVQYNRGKPRARLVSLE
jgi:hypothetical protein